MKIEELIRQQREFDEKHKGSFNWSEKINENNVEILEYLLICMVGEFGETANLIKKVVRGDCKLEDIRESLTEEVVDMLIYLIKIIYQLDINVEEAYSQKMRKNKVRFERFEKELE